MDAFDQIHVVSDLHFGGAPGQQVFNQGAALAEVIDYLARQPKTKKIGLVLNGDVVDFIAAPDALAFDPVGSPRKLDVVMKDPAFAPVFDALGRFTAAPGRSLVVVIGNHDIELALPGVKDLLLDRIAGDDAARGRVRFALDGTGYSCTVGGRRVLCVHGNEVDDWNIVDQEGLRRVAKAQNHGIAPPEFAANAGSTLVVEVMNLIKSTHPFVDLLKPETVPVLEVIVSAGLESRIKLGAVAKILAKKAAVDTSQFMGDGVGEVDGDTALRAVLESKGKRAATPAAPKAADDPLDAMLHSRANNESALDAVGKGGDEKLGVLGVIWDRVRGRSPQDNLREALATYLGDDRTFDPFADNDPLFAPLDKRTGAEVHFLVAGHSHLEKKLTRKQGAGVYFNSGTWIRLIQLRPELLEDAAKFQPVYQALTAPSLERIDATPGLVIQRRTIVSIERRGDQVVGELRHGREAGKSPAGQAPWDAVPGSEYAC